MLDQHRDTADRLRRAIEGVIGVPATEGNRIDALRNGDEIFPAMLDAIDGAQHTIDFLTFVYWKGSIGEDFARHLAARAQQGVRVRVLLDSYGAQSMDPSTVDVLQRSGVHVEWFRPLHRLRLGDVNHRTHRKVLIVDEAIAFTGGVGIADEWRGNASSPDEWRDTHFRIRGPAVDGLRAAFLDNWSECDLTLFDVAIDRFPSQPKVGDAITQCVRGAAETGWSDIATLFRTLLQLAEERVRITTAYFIPDPDLTERMCAAAERGVRVELLLPGPHIDKRFVQLASEATFDRLLEGGVHIWCFQPTMVHAKVMTVDGLLANIGSANFNTRSTQLDEEVNLVVLDPALVGTLDAHFDEDLERSKEIRRGRWQDRSLMQRGFEFLATPARRWF
jgi:cardiolipin synthase A/B